MDSKTILSIHVTTKKTQNEEFEVEKMATCICRYTNNIGLRECRVDLHTKTWNNDVSDEKSITHSYNTVTTDQNSSTTSCCAHTQWTSRKNNNYLYRHQNTVLS